MKTFKILITVKPNKQGDKVNQSIDKELNANEAVNLLQTTADTIAKAMVRKANDNGFATVDDPGAVAYLGNLKIKDIFN